MEELFEFLGFEANDGFFFADQLVHAISLDVRTTACAFIFPFRVWRM